MPDLRRFRSAGEVSLPPYVVGIAASAGGIEAVSVVLAGLPASLSAAVLLVQHLDPTHPSLLSAILVRHTRLVVEQAREGVRVRAGHAYVAPPNHHLLIDAQGHIDLTQSERIRFVRPSADVTFESLAAAFRQRAIAVVLTGMGRDGSDGVREIQARGGTVIVQDPDDARFRAMPDAAIATDSVDFVLPLHEIAAHLIRLTATSSRGVIEETPSHG